MVFCLPLQSDIKSGLPTPPSRLGEVGTTCCRALMDSLTRCASGRSKDAIMPVMAVRAKTGTRQDESKPSVRGGGDAAAVTLRRQISSQGLTTPSVTAPHPLHLDPPRPPGKQRPIVIARLPSFPTRNLSVPRFVLLVKGNSLK